MQDMTLRIAQWGATVLVSVQTALYFIRQHVVMSGSFDLGTKFLFFIALLFAFVADQTAAKRYHNYRKQLTSSITSGITELRARPANRLFWVLFLLFPLFDFLLGHPSIK